MVKMMQLRWVEMDKTELEGDRWAWLYSLLLATNSQYIMAPTRSTDRKEIMIFSEDDADSAEEGSRVW
jgi:hypothetical protein